MKPVATSKITARERNTGRRINAHGGNGLGTRIAAEAHAHNIPVSMLCAFVDQESKFQNVFGHDPTSSIPSRWMGTKVTALKYRYYKIRRNRGYGAQGVGPCQLTSPGYQDQADRDGGCRHSDVNIATAAKALSDIHATHQNWHDVAEIYNAGHLGTEQGRRYAEQVMSKQRIWHARLV